MDNKKSGIRLRHLEQQPQEGLKRDVSPNNPNRKKIFDKNQRLKLNQRLISDQRQKKKNKNDEQNYNQYEELVENLKKRTMEIELRDETIKYLNKQIQDLKNQLKLKDKEIGKLNQEIATLQKEQSNLKNAQNAQNENVFESFKNPTQIVSYSYSEANRANNHSIESGQAKIKGNYQQNRLNQQISLGNLNHFKHNYNEKGDEAQILSPFMALNNTHSFSNQYSNKDRQNKKQIKTSRISNQNDYHHTSTEYSGFNKKKTNNQFDFNKEDYVPKKSMIDSVNKQLQKFNIFGEPLESKKEMHVRSQLQIEDSRQFKFDEYDDKGYDFGSNVIY